MRSIQEVFQDIKETKKTANIDIENVSYNVRPGFMANIVQAKTKLPDLLKELKDIVVPNRLVGLFAKGETEGVAKFFVENGSLVADANEMYKFITNSVEETIIGQRLFSDTQYSRLVSELRFICIDQGYKEIPPPKQTEEKVPAYKDTLAVVKRLVRDCVGDALAIKRMVDSILDTVLTNKMDAKQIAVLVTGIASSEEHAAISALFSRSVDYTFNKGYVPNKANIQKILKQEEEIK